MAVNRFDKPVTTGYESQFIPVEMPAQLMLQAIGNKQKTYDDTLANFLNLGEWTQRALPGYDTQYVKDWQQKVQDTITEISDKDLSLPQYRRQYMSFLSNLKKDEGLKKVTRAVSEHDAFLEREKALKEGKPTDFDYAFMHEYRQRFKEYTKDPTKGGLGFQGDIALGDPHILSGTDINGDLEKYFDQIKADGYEIPKLLNSGLAYKDTWTGIKGEKIDAQVARTLDLAYNSRAGDQIGKRFDQRMFPNQIPSIALEAMSDDKRREYEIARRNNFIKEFTSVGRGFQFNKFGTNQDVALRDQWHYERDQEDKIPVDPLLSGIGPTQKVNNESIDSMAMNLLNGRNEERQILKNKELWNSAKQKGFGKISELTADEAKIIERGESAMKQDDYRLHAIHVQRKQAREKYDSAMDDAMIKTGMQIGGKSYIEITNDAKRAANNLGFTLEPGKGINQFESSGISNEQIEGAIKGFISAPWSPASPFIGALLNSNESTGNIDTYHKAYDRNGNPMTPQSIKYLINEIDKRLNDPNIQLTESESNYYKNRKSDLNSVMNYQALKMSEDYVKVKNKDVLNDSYINNRSVAPLTTVRSKNDNAFYPIRDGKGNIVDVQRSKGNRFTYADNVFKNYLPGQQVQINGQVIGPDHPLYPDVDDPYFRTVQDFDDLYKGVHPVFAVNGNPMNITVDNIEELSEADPLIANLYKTDLNTIRNMDSKEKAKYKIPQKNLTYTVIGTGMDVSSWNRLKGNELEGQYWTAAKAGDLQKSHEALVKYYKVNHPDISRNVETLVNMRQPGGEATFNMQSYDPSSNSSDDYRIVVKTPLMENGKYSVYVEEPSGRGGVWERAKLRDVDDIGAVGNLLLQIKTGISLTE